MATPCMMDLYCLNSKMITGTEARAKCALCRLSPDNTGRDMAHYWRPTQYAKDTRKDKHPNLKAEKLQKKIAKHQAKLVKNRQRDPQKRQISRLARQAEKSTERNIIHATQNSGRRNRDGDHVHGNNITLDTKLQTTRENPVILLVELEKVRADAVRSGKKIGGLVIRNKHNVGVVVLAEEDYALLTKGLDESAH